MGLGPHWPVAALMASVEVVYILTHVAYLYQLGATELVAVALRWLARWWRAPDQEDAEIREQVSELLKERHVRCARFVVVWAWNATCIYCAQLIPSLLFSDEDWSANTVIMVVLLLVSTFAAVFQRHLVTAQTLPSLHIIFMLIMALLAIFPVPTLMVSMHRMLLALGSALLSCVCLRFRLIAATNSVLLVCTLVTSLREKELSREVGFEKVVMGEMVGFILKMALFYVGDAVVRLSATKEVEARLGKCQRSAVSSLLDLFCDAVIDLDHMLKIKDHVPKLAGLLMLTPDRLLQGLPLSAFIREGEDRTKFEAALSTGGTGASGSTAPCMLTLRMRDSLGNLFEMFLYHVSYVSVSGAVHHLVGLREDSDHGSALDRFGSDEMGAPRFPGLPEAALRPHIAQKLRPPEGLTPGHVRTRSQSMPRLGAGVGIAAAGISSSGSVSSVGDAASSLSASDTQLAGPEMCVSVFLRTRLPVQWAGQRLKDDLGVEAGGGHTLAEVLPDGGQCLHGQLFKELHQRLAVGDEGGFHVSLGSVWVSRLGATAAEPPTRRHIWAFFPSPLPSGAVSEYCVTLGFSEPRAAGLTAPGRGAEAIGIPPLFGLATPSQCRGAPSVAL